MNFTYHISLIILTLLLISFRLKIAKIFKIIDKPDNYRKLHINPTPSIGGLIIYLNFLPSLLFFNDDLKTKYIFIWLFLATFFFFLGLVDDRVQLKPLVKTFLVITVLLITLPLDEKLIFNNLLFADVKYVVTLKQSALFFTALSIFLIYNSINFSDGLNGIASSQSIFWLIFLIYFDSQKFIYITLLSCLIIIFLFNIFGKLFLGNSGSSIISILLSLFFLKIYNENLIKFDEIILIFFLINIDAIRIIIERVIDNRSPFSGDNNHFHHLLCKIINRKLVYIPYFLLSIMPFVIYSIFEIKTYSVLIFSTIFYFLILIYLKKNKNV